MVASMDGSRPMHELAPSPPSLSQGYPRPPCHLRATSDGHVRYRADNHGQNHSIDELVVSRATSLNASREYA